MSKLFYNARNDWRRQRAFVKHGSNICHYCNTPIRKGSSPITFERDEYTERYHPACYEKRLAEKAARREHDGERND